MYPNLSKSIFEHTSLLALTGDFYVGGQTTHLPRCLCYIFWHLQLLVQCDNFFCDVVTFCVMRQLLHLSRPICGRSQHVPLLLPSTITKLPPLCFSIGKIFLPFMTFTVYVIYNTVLSLINLILFSWIIKYKVGCVKYKVQSIESNRGLLERSFMLRNYKTSSIKSKCHKLLPAVAEQPTTAMLLLAFWYFAAPIIIRRLILTTMTTGQKVRKGSSFILLWRWWWNWKRWWGRWWWWWWLVGRRGIVGGVVRWWRVPGGIGHPSVRQDHNLHKN